MQWRWRGKNRDRWDETSDRLRRLKERLGFFEERD
jgi:hypothetical protein